MGRLVLVMLVLAGCRQVFGLAEPSLASDAAPDGADADDAAPDAMPPWGVPVELTELGSDDGEDDPTLTADMLEIYFGSERPGGAGLEDIWFSSRASVTDPWSTPIVVTELNSPAIETGVAVVPDGLTIYFSSDRVNGDMDVYVSTRTSRADAWTPAVRILELSSPLDDYSPAPATWSPHERILLCVGASAPDHAIYAATRASAFVAWDRPAKIAELDAPNVDDCDPEEPTPNAVYFSTNRTTADRANIYVARRASATDTFGTPVVIDEINDPTAYDRDPWVSADERTIVFSSDRGGIGSRLYMSTR